MDGQWIIVIILFIIAIVSIYFSGMAIYTTPEYAYEPIQGQRGFIGPIGPKGDTGPASTVQGAPGDVLPLIHLGPTISCDTTPTELCMYGSTDGTVLYNIFNPRQCFNDNSLPQIGIVTTYCQTDRNVNVPEDYVNLVQTMKVLPAQAFFYDTIRYRYAERQDDFNTRWSGWKSLGTGGCT